MQDDRPLKRARGEQEEDDGTADQGRTKTEFELAEAERRESQNISSFADAIWSQSQSYHRRSQYRSQLGKHSEALSDARKALQFFPENAMYLLRTAEALAACGYQTQAVKALEQVSPAIATTAQADALELEEGCFRLRKNIHPVVFLPDELLGNILHLVHEDWKSLRSPFALAHICSGWRRIALSRQSLWRDLRILRCAQNICFNFVDHRESRLQDPTILKANKTFLEMVKFCDEHANHTITHFEVAALEDDLETAQAAVKIATLSAQTLRTLRIVDTRIHNFSSSLPHISDFDDDDSDSEDADSEDSDSEDSDSEDGNPQYRSRPAPLEQHCSLSLQALLLASQATQVNSLELCLLGLDKEHASLFEAHLRSPPLRQTWPLQLSLSGFSYACGVRPQTRSASLRNTTSFFASLASSATALRLWTPHLPATGFTEGFEPDDTLTTILPAAASTLSHLEMSSWWLSTATFRDPVRNFLALESLQLLDAKLVNLGDPPIHVPEWPDRAILPKLCKADGFLQALLPFADDQLRHAVLYCNVVLDHELLRDLQQNSSFRSLEHLHVILTSDRDFDDRESEFVAALFSWLLDDVAVVDQESHTTPCPNLRVFHLSRWYGAKPYDKEPENRQRWEARCQTSSFVAKLERSRRLRSQGLWSLPNKEQVKPAVPAAFRRGPQKSTDSPSTASIPAITHPPSCVALEKIVLSGCHIDAAVWAALQASPCEVTCDVDPFKMEKLPYAVEKKNRSRRTLGP